MRQSGLTGAKRSWAGGQPSSNGLERVIAAWLAKAHSNQRWRLLLVRLPSETEKQFIILRNKSTNRIYFLLVRLTRVLTPLRLVAVEIAL